MFSMKCKCLILIFLIVAGLMLSGCIESDEDTGQNSALFIPKPVNVSLIPDYTHLDLDNIDTGVKIPPIQVRNIIPGFCDLES